MLHSTKTALISGILHMDYHMFLSKRPFLDIIFSAREPGF